MRAEGGSSNLINGVSRQSPEVRLPSQLEESVNQFPSVTKGLVPRNPAILKGRVSGSPATDTFFHLIDRDASERYAVRVSPSGVVVHDLDGTPRSVATPNGIGYLSGAAAEDYDAITVADHTFVVNKKKVVAEGSTTSPPAVAEALLHVAAGEYHTKYEIVLNGSVVASINTQGGPYGDNHVARVAEKGTRGTAITYALRHGVVDPSVATSDGGNEDDPDIVGVISGGLHTLNPTEWEATIYENVIHLKNKLGNDFTIQANAAGRELAFRAHKGTVRAFSELPRKAPDGFVIKVEGSRDTDFDDYWVKFEKGTNDGAGRWKETVAPDTKTGFDPETMPHVLVRESDGNFTFKQAPWAPRKVGDLDTNPWPSFVGRSINGLAFEKNRFGIISGENVAFSRHGEFYDFFVETAQTALDTDPVDAAISYDDVSTIHHAVSLAGELVLFTASVPFRLIGGEVFSQKTANFVPTLAHKSSSRARPVACGDRLFFVNDTESGCFVHEFLNIQDETTVAAPTVTEHVQGYVPAGVTMVDGSDALKVLALVSPADPSTVYVYKWLIIGQQKAQSAWQKWTLQAPIRALKIIDEELVLVLDQGTAVEHVGINCHEAWSDGDKPAIIHLDRRVGLAGTYNSGLDQTTFTTPYPATGAIAVLTAGDDFGFQPAVISDTGNSLVVEGDHSGSVVYVGFEYPSYGELSEFILRQKTRDGGEGAAVPGVNVKVASMRFDTGPSVGMKVTLTRAYRAPYVYDLSAALVGTKTSPLGAMVVGKLSKSLSIMAASEDVTIRFENHGPYPYRILSYRWSGGAYPKSY